MAVSQEEHLKELSKGYRFDWKDPSHSVFEPKKGLDASVVEEISALKDEPDWMRKFRLKALKHFDRRPMPWWGADLSGIDFDDIEIGYRVHVKGSTSGSALLASEIVVQNTITTIPVNVNGVIDSLAGDEDAFQFKIGSRLIKGDEETEFFGNGNADAFEDLENGVRVETNIVPPELHAGIDYAAYAFDPDGHCIELYYYMEQVGWDGRPRPKELRRKVDPNNWPEILEPQ